MCCGMWLWRTGHQLPANKQLKSQKAFTFAAKWCVTSARCGCEWGESGSAEIKEEKEKGKSIATAKNMNSAKTMLNISPKMSNRVASDKKELEKYVKMFSTKAVQAIVQSRLGDKIQTFSNPRSLSNDWVRYIFISFFLSILIAQFKLRHCHRRRCASSGELITRILRLVPSIRFHNSSRCAFSVIVGSLKFFCFYITNSTPRMASPCVLVSIFIYIASRCIQHSTTSE